MIHYKSFFTEKFFILHLSIYKYAESYNLLKLLIYSRFFETTRGIIIFESNVCR